MLYTFCLGKILLFFSFSEALKKPEVKTKEPEAKKTKFTIIPPNIIYEKEVEKRVEDPAGNVSENEILKETETADTIVHDKAKGLEVVHITGLNQLLKNKGLEIYTASSTAQHDGPTHTSATATGTDAGSSGATGQKGDTKRIPRPRSPIVMEDTLGDIYYKTYTEERGNEAHVNVWGLKQKDTFVDFGACRDWFLGTFPPWEVNHQRAHNHESLYRAYVISEANTSAASHQILRDGRTMHREYGSWEKYRERLSAEAKEFEQLKNQLQEEKAAFDKEKKSEEWGREGLISKLQACEELLAKEQKEWLLACDNDNKKMFAARTKITNLEAEVVDLNVQILSKNRDLASKDAEITELKRRYLKCTRRMGS
ncbi:hypothetical protein Hanom_Chr08g00713261 [Helianthus anomalus]